MPRVGAADVGDADGVTEGPVEGELVGAEVGKSVQLISHVSGQRSFNASPLSVNWSHLPDFLPTHAQERSAPLFTKKVSLVSLHSILGDSEGVIDKDGI